MKKIILLSLSCSAFFCAEAYSNETKMPARKPSSTNQAEIFEMAIKDSKGEKTCFKGQVKKFVSSLSSDGGGRPIDLDVRDFSLIPLESVEPRNNGYNCEKSGNFTNCDFKIEENSLLVLKASTVNSGEFINGSVVFKISESTRYLIKGDKNFDLPGDDKPIDEKKTLTRTCKIAKF